MAVQIKRILFPCDLSENASKIIPYVLSLAEKYAATIHLIYVVEDLVKLGGWSFVPHFNLGNLQKELEVHAVKTLDEFCKSHLRGCDNFKQKVASGDPAMEILKEVDSEGIDMVVMGTHGRKGLEHTIFGSVAENVVKKSPVPVVVINPYKVK